MMSHRNFKLKISPTIIRTAIYCAAVILMSTPMSFAEDESVGAVFLSEAVGARPAAMGEAFTAVNDDVNSMYWNPAGLIRSMQTELLVTHTEFINGVRGEYLAYTMPLSSNDAIGLNAYFSYINNLEKITHVDAEPVPYGSYDIYLSAGWSHAFDQWLAIGGSAKFIYQTIDIYSAWSVAADIGVSINDLILPDLGLAAVIRHVGMPIKFLEEAYLLPLSITLGAAYPTLNKSLLTTVDVEIPWQQDIFLKAGAEYNIDEVIFFRLGYKYALSGNDLGPLSGLTAGLGAEISDYKVDYAFSMMGAFGNIHRIAVTFPFGRTIVEEEKVIKRLEKKIQARQQQIIKSYVVKGDRLFNTGSYEKALDLYERTLALNPNYPYIKRKIKQSNQRIKSLQARHHYKKGKSAYKRGDYLLALIELNKVKELSPRYKDIRTWLKKVNKKLTEDKNGKQRGSYRGNKGSSIEPYFSQGLDYLRQERYKKAIKVWRKALAANPNHGKIKKYIQEAKMKMEEEIAHHLRRANLFWSKKQTIKAVKAWNKVLRIDSHHGPTKKQLRVHYQAIADEAERLYKAGVQNYVQNKLVEAIANWKDVLVLDPQNEKAIKNLQRARQKLEEIEAIHK